MSLQHPILAIVGASGAGTSTVSRCFQRCAQAQKVQLDLIEGDAFHRYTRKQMRDKIRQYQCQGRLLTHLSPEANHLEKLADLFYTYAHSGTGKTRRYLHTPQEAALQQQEVGTFTPWTNLSGTSDALLYEGLHAAITTEDLDLAQYPDALIGVCPVINLEWLQKIQRDHQQRNYVRQDVLAEIARRIPDYIQYICPQFNRTDLNFQRVPLVDTSDPLATETVAPEHSLWILHIRRTHLLDLKSVLAHFPQAQATAPHTLMLPGQYGEALIQFCATLLLKKVCQSSTRSPSASQYTPQNQPKQPQCIL